MQNMPKNNVLQNTIKHEAIWIQESCLELHYLQQSDDFNPF